MVERGTTTGLSVPLRPALLFDRHEIQFPNHRSGAELIHLVAQLTLRLGARPHAVPK